VAVTLGDLLLVLLGDVSASAHQVQQRHAATFGSLYPAEITRVMPVLRRQAAFGYIRPGGTAARNNQPVWQLTETGRHRQHAWQLDIRPGADSHELLIRVLLAVEAADRGTYEAVIDTCLAMVEQRRNQSRLRRGPMLATADVRAEFARVESAALVEWLRKLRGRYRRRDQAA